ncbi:MAG: hypothetical protein QM687_11415 [Ferruginibacter sp.]
MKKIFAFSSFLCLAASVQAQYYYKDILSNKQTKADMAAYKTNKVKTINIKSFEGDGAESEGFFAQKKFSKDYKKAELFSRSAISSPSLQTSLFNNNGDLLQSTDSSDLSVTRSYYQYTADGQVASITSVIRSSDDDFTSEITEEHLYSYSAAGLLEKMIRVKNKRDSVTILFAPDEKGNIGIEKDTKTGTKYYYYYDAKNRLTDVVQENDFKTMMRPDYIFEYNNTAGLVSQMTTSEEGVNNYYVWKYSYENGLRVREKCFSKERRLMGTIEYEYK